MSAADFLAVWLARAHCHVLSRLFDRDVHGLVKFFSRLQGGAYTPDVSVILLNRER